MIKEMDIPRSANYIDIIKLMRWNKISVLEDIIKIAKRTGATHFTIDFKALKDFDYDKHGFVLFKMTTEAFDIYLEEEREMDKRALKRINKNDPILKKMKSTK